MSRTYRRTSGQHHELSTWVTKPTLDGNEIFVRVVLLPGHEGYKKAYAEVHTDTRHGIYGVPSWYCRILNRQAARQEEQVLSRALRSGELDSVVFKPRKKSAGYDWW